MPAGQRQRVRLALPHCHQRKRQTWRSLDDLLPEPVQPEGSNALQGEATAALVCQALRQMPAGYRLALLVHLVAGDSLQEIAQRMDIALGGAKMFLFRARAAFREHYALLQQGKHAA